jgi:hypothetical protein
MGKRWTEEEREYVRQHYADTDTDEMAARLGRTRSAVNEAAAKLGVKKSHAYLVELGEKCAARNKGKGTFKPGHKTWNKGMKGFKPGGRCAEYQFKPGNIPWTTKHDGAITRRIDKSGLPAYFIRVKKGKWVPLRRAVWIAAHGPIPRGYNIIHKDGDWQNCRIENLECLSNAELMRRNSILNYPREVVETIWALRTLNNTLKNKKKHGTE